MHQIQKLELVGFKSFCDRTTVAFNEGTTAIVGPNGCGKSNIADAISWVVGEQSAKSLRTDKMEGVIFNGTQARKATGLAEVTLTLMLMDHFSIPEGLELRAEGFTVGRRLYRSGESEYYLDGRRCRLKDIQALFEGTGLGPNSYALIEQGRIGQILSSKPADRRSLIEEAARITLFKSRRYSAEAKLEAAQQNLLRVSDIIREVARQLNSLRRQAAKARRYARLREELRGVQRLKFGLEERLLRSKLDECKARFAAAQEREAATLAELARGEESRATIQELCRSREETIEQEREKLLACRVDSANAASRRENQQAQVLSLGDRTKQIEVEQRTLAEREAVVRREHDRVNAALGSIAAEIGSERDVLEAEHARAMEIEIGIRETESAIDEMREFVVNGAGRLAELRSLRTRSVESLDRIAAQVAKIEGEREIKARERAGLMDELEACRGRAAANAARLGEVSQQLEQLDRKARELTTRFDEVTSELTAQQEEHSLMQHRYSSLEEVERRRSNYSEGVQKFLATQLPGEEEHPRHTLADHLETDPVYEAAIEDYLNDQLQYILVDELDDAIHNVERLKRIGAGKCTFLTIHNGGAHEEARHTNGIGGEGVVGYLKDLVRMRDDVRRAFERALPEFASTVMVNDLHTAFRVAETHPGGSYLTLSGEAYSPRGTLSAVGERKSMAGFLALKREKRELESRLAVVRERLLTTRAEQARLKEEELRNGEAARALEVEHRRLELDSVSIGHQMERFEAEIGKVDQGESVAALELSQLLADRSALDAKRLDSEAAIAEIEERGRTSEERLRELSIRLETLRSENTTAARRLAELVSAHAVKKERQSSLENDLRRLAGEAALVAGRARDFEAEKTSTAARIVELERAQQETLAQVEQFRRDIETLEAELSARQQELAADREAMAAVEETMRRLHLEREDALGARSKVEIEMTRIESDLEHLTRSCRDEFHLPLEELLAQIPHEEWHRGYDEVSASYEDLRDRVENFGAINMRALEEYQELDQRYQFLTHQRSDIEQSIADTQKAIADINRRSIEQFQEAFQRIRENFIDVFQILFKGGQCDLRLLDETDPLESGLDIIAQPPGKRLQNVLLLSGGEKALTALALLIAIFRYRPSPFCVLDEVDAPLDDANVGRFTQLINELSKDTQFLLITHNKRTMEIADTLYGVTMEEPGVSKIVSVDFRRREAV